MADPSISPNVFSLLHEYVRAVALGLLGLLFAYTAVQHIALRLGGQRTRLLAGNSLRRGLIIGLVLVGSLPAASLGLLLAERSAHIRQDRVSNQLRDLARTMAADVDQFLDKHRAGVVSATQAVHLTNDFGHDRLTQWLKVFHANYPDFLTMMATDDRGNIVAATSLISGLPAPVSNLSGQNVSDRPYFKRPMATGAPFVSKVFQGRGLGRDPIVAVSAPLVGEGGEHVGIVEGSVNLRAFDLLEVERSLVDDTTIIVLDSAHRVIYASAGAAVRELQSLADHPLVAGAREIGIGRDFQYADATGGQSSSFIGASAATQSGWIVLLNTPQTIIERQMLGDYKVALGLLLAAIVLSFGLASAIARRVSNSVEGLSNVVKGFNLDGEGEDIVIPEETPDEFRPIFAQMRRRSRHLRQAHKRLQNSIATGEQLRRELSQSVARQESEIEARTAELESANAKLEEINRRDALTGIANRRAFEQFEERAWRLCAREREPLTLVMIDIDFFKDFNDSRGHQQGDDCLRQVAETLASCATRPMDIVARYGGEEFVAVLTSTPLEKGLIVADRMRRAVQGLQIPHDGSPRGVVTVSVGVAAADPGSQDNSEATLRDADKALYEAKSSGRNRVYFTRGGTFYRFRQPQSTPPIAIADV